MYRWCYLPPKPDLNSAVEALRHGATDYLVKPLKPEMFIEKTQKILFARQKEQRKREIALQIEALQAELKMLETQEVDLKSACHARPKRPGCGSAT